MLLLFRLKAQHKGKFTCTFQSATRSQPVKTDTVVKAQQSKHRQVKPHT